MLPFEVAIGMTMVCVSPKLTSNVATGAAQPAEEPSEVVVHLADLAVVLSDGVVDDAFDAETNRVNSREAGSVYLFDGDRASPTFGALLLTIKNPAPPVSVIPPACWRPSRWGRGGCSIQSCPTRSAGGSPCAFPATATSTTPPKFCSGCSSFRR